MVRIQGDKVFGEASDIEGLGGRFKTYIPNRDSDLIRICVTSKYALRSNPSQKDSYLMHFSCHVSRVLLFGGAVAFFMRQVQMVGVRLSLLGRAERGYLQIRRKKPPLC